MWIPYWLGVCGLPPQVRERLLSGSHLRGSNVRMGVSTNFNRLCGCIEDTIIDTRQLLARFPAQWAQVKQSATLSHI